MDLGDAVGDGGGLGAAARKRALGEDGIVRKEEEISGVFSSHPLATDVGVGVVLKALPWNFARLSKSLRGMSWVPCSPSIRVGMPR